MSSPLSTDKDYSLWIKELKSKIRSVQIKAALSVNSELLHFYWELGAEIIQKQVQSKWGDKFLSSLSNDLMAEFPDMKGFSKRNLELIRQWHQFYAKDHTIAKQIVSQLAKIPWGHNIAIISKCQDIDEAIFYIQNTQSHNWSRSVLIHQIENGAYLREGKSLTNFSATLPAPQSDLAYIRLSHDEQGL